MGNPYQNAFSSGTGTLSFSVNGGARQTVNLVNSGFPANDLTADDVYVLNDTFSSTFAVHNQLVLTAGSITTTENVAAAAPAGGPFTTFVTDAVGRRISSNGVAGAPTAAAPEPGTIALLLTAGAPLVGIVRRRTKNRA